MSSLYMDHILDLYKNPHNFGVLYQATVQHRAFNPLCGDDITVYLKVGGTDPSVPRSGTSPLGRGELVIKDVTWEGKGCAISMASASLVTDYIKHKTPAEIMKLDKQALLDMLGIEVGPVRLKCALLGLEATQGATGKLLNG